MGRCLVSKTTMKKKLAIIAPTGMLGNGVYKQLHEKYDLILLYRKKEYVMLLPQYANHTLVQCDFEVIYKEYKEGFSKGELSPTFSNIIKQVGDVDGVINCTGITKPHALENPELTFFINGALPHLLSEVYKEKLIQIATDCVFDGNN